MTPISSALAEITGIRELATSIPDTTRQEQVKKLLEDSLSVASTVSTSSVSACESDQPTGGLVLDPKPSRRTIDDVYQSWDIVRQIPNYQEVAGVLLFQK